jgi:hypothetical protein
MSAADSNPARQSAGGAAGAHGVSFQAQAAAWWIGQVLVRNGLVGRQFGIEENTVPVRVGGQTGMFTDDLGIEFSNGQRSFGQCKSRVRVSADWPNEKNEFASAWFQFCRQLRHCGPDENPCLVLCYEKDTEPLQNLASILDRHRNHGGQRQLDDARIAVTSSERRVANTLLQLLDCLSSAPELAGLKADRSRLLRCTYLHHLRMHEGAGDYLQLAQQLQSSVLAEADQIGDAMRLIFGLGEKLHKERTSVGLEQLRREFRLARIELQDVRDHREDWRRLEEVSAGAKASVFTSIGRSLHLKRLPEIERVQNTLKTSHGVVMLGPSGGGKSGVVKVWADDLDATQNRVVWFSAAELDALPTPDLRSGLGLRFSLRQLFEAAATTTGYVVIDAIDRCFSEGGLQRVREILEACALEGCESIWRVIFTCQDTEWAQVLPRLLRARVPLPQDTKSGVVGHLTGKELAAISSQIPALRHLVSQHHLRELLIKPKVLDLIAHYVETGGQVDARSFVGESQLIAWWWHAEVQVGSRAHARAAALSEIAQRQADLMRVSIALDELSPSVRDLIDELAQSRLLVVSGNRVNFAHDLYGDWARQQVLLAHGSDLRAFALPGMKSPLWHKPLRLYALHQLEQGSDANAWERDWRGFAGNSVEAQLASDLFLEAVVFAVEPKPILEKLWPRLSSENATLLSRFLRRFQYTASIPDEFFLSRARVDGPEHVIETAAAIRRPLLARWPSVIEFLHAHCDEVAALVPGELAKMAFTWFGWTEPGSRGRREIAALIASAAEHCCRLGLHDYRSRDEDWVEQVYRSALRAFAEEPDRVRELSLRLCGRKENDWLIKEEPKPRTPLPESLANDPAFQEIANTGVTTPIGGPIENWKVVGPWPDGPQFGVSREFREAFLKGDAHRPMIDNDPALASEVLLSLLIEHSHRESPFDAFGSSRLDEDRGLQSHDSLEQPFYNTGPFLYFLQSRADAGLEFLLKFINFASERWAEQFKHRDEEIWKVTIHLADEEHVLFGDWRLYYAYRNASWIHGAIRTGVMALEKWLHDKIEAGLPVDEVIDRILDGSRSVAFAGVLIAIAKRRNELLWTKLWPLTSAAEFHCWEAAQNGQFVPGTATGWNEPPQLRERRAKWNNLPFRHENLLRLCCRLFLDDPIGRKQLGRLKNIWRRRARALPKDASFKSTLSQLAQRFDLEYWARAKDEDGETTWAFTPPPAPPGADANEASSSESEPLQLTALPFLCRDAIEGGEWPLAREPEQLWELLEVVLEVARDEAGETYGLPDPQNAVAGLIAVLLTFHREWLRADPARERGCIENMLRVPERAARPLPELFDGNGDETWWAIFCAKQLPPIWAETPASPSIRAAIARVVISGSDTAVALLSRNLFSMRKRLAIEFEQTQTLLLHDAVERNRHQWARALDDDPARYAAWIEREVTDFSGGNYRVLPTDWLAIRHPQFPMHHGHSYRFEKRTTRQNYGMDFDRVVAAFEWIPSLDQAASPAERKQWILIHRQILGCLLGTFPCLAEGSQEYEGLPYQVDRQVLARSAKLALELSDGENHAAFWQPVLALGSAARAWVEDFIRDFLMPIFGMATPPAHFARRWKAMIEFAESSPEWQSATVAKPWELEKLWLDLIGMDSLLNSCWQPEHRDIVAELWPNVERWAQRYLVEEESLRSFLHFMKLPVAAEWIPHALILINDGIANCSHSLAEDFPEDELARFLVLVHEHHASVVRRIPKAYDVFMHLVAGLAAEQNRIALELQGRLAGQPT